MVRIRYQILVKAELEKLGLPYVYVRIGEADIIVDIQPEQVEQLNIDFKRAGLLLMDNIKVSFERNKSAIIELANYTEDQTKVNLLDYFNEKLNYHDTYLANLFSEEKSRKKIPL